jgi:hypothetical protein
MFNLKLSFTKVLSSEMRMQLSLSEDKTILARDLGNVNEDTEVTFEYKMKSIKKLLQMPELDMTKINIFPF